VLTKNFNVWLDAPTVWIPEENVKACLRSIDVAEFEGQVCYGGLDLAATKDFTAFNLYFPNINGKPAHKTFYFMPEATIEKKKHDGPYYEWLRNGHIIATPGNVVDQVFIREEINRLGSEFSIQELAFDPWNATKISTELAGDGFQVVELRQGFRSLSEPTKHLGALVASKMLRHGGHPVLRWMASNVAIETDAAGNIKPSKKASTEKIDGIVALIMAVDRATRHTARSVYDRDGAEVFTV
jgi:phage terminase large subunit-like protein